MSEVTWRGDEPASAPSWHLPELDGLSEADYCAAARAARETRYRPVRTARRVVVYRVPAGVWVWLASAWIAGLAAGVWLGASVMAGTPR